MEYETIDTEATRLLGIGSKSLREGRNLNAQRVFGGLANQQKFSYRGQAAYGEALALARQGKFPEASKKLKTLKEQFTDKIMLRAKILRAYSETKIAQGQFDGVDEALDEAAEIFKYQGELVLLGAIVHLQGIVATQKGELGLSIQDFDWAQMFGDTYIPDYVPEHWVTDQPSEKPVIASTPAVLAGV